MSELQEHRRGNDPDYLFGCSLGWDALDVVRWHGREALSEPYAYDIVLLRTAERGHIDLAPLLDAPATLRIASEARWRGVHGVVAHAELLEHTRRLLLYRVVLVPALERTRHRRRCRTFVERSIEFIVEAVLENRAPQHPQGLRGLQRLSDSPRPPATRPDFTSFRAPVAQYRWALTDPERVHVPQRMVVQYNESDYDFLARLLEAYGLSYFFEEADDGSVLTLTDRPGHAALFARDDAFELVSDHVSGTSRDQEVVRTFRPAHRLRPGSVTMRDYAWRKSTTRLEANQRTSDTELDHYEFPAADEDEPNRPGLAPATFQMERFAVERALSRGRSSVRVHQPGYRFRLTDRATVRPDADLVTTAVEAYAVQLLPQHTLLDHESFGFAAGIPDTAYYDCQFEAVPAALRYRPARHTSKPSVAGVQPARVTAEEINAVDGAVELNSDEMGRVRVRFPWDQRENDGTPTSKWIRVSQYWAGPAFGAQYTPRVGHEVLIAFERGDPDRPIIVGRLYNAQNQPPYMEPNTTKSTLKSDSVGADGESADGFNELRFDDLAGKEQVFLHAQRNLDETVRANHSTGVGGDQSNGVGGDRTHTVQGMESVTVEGNRNTHFGANESHGVVAHRNTGIGNNDTHTIGDNHFLTVGVNQRIEVGAQRNVVVGASHFVSAGGGYHSQAQGSHTFTSKTCSINQGESIELRAAGATLSMSAGCIVLDNGAGSTLTMLGGLVSVTCGAFVTMAATNSLAATGNNILMSGCGTLITAGGNIDASAAFIKLNG